MGVTLRKKGKKWGVRVRYKGKDKFVIIGTKESAGKIKANIEQAIARKKFALDSPEKKPDSLTFNEYGSLYLAFIKSSNRAPRTCERYAGVLERIKATPFGRKPIDQISRGDVRDLLLKESRRGYSRASVEIVHTVCSGVFNYALDDEVIMSIPSRGLIKRLDLKKDQADVNPLTAEEMELALQAVPDKYRYLFSLLWHTGARIGEALALEWDDVDFKNRKISIEKTAKDQTVRATTKNYIKRKVPMSDTLLSLLVKLKAEDKKLCFRKGYEQKHLFHTEDGRLLSDNTIRRVWSKTCRDKIKIGHRRIHDIRHTTASLLLMRGAPITFVQKLLGHSSAKMTLDRYSKYMESEDCGFIDLMNNQQQSEISRNVPI